MGRDTEDDDRDRRASAPKVRAHAEWNELESVRIHRPGIETFAGVLDPEPNLFLEEFSLDEAQREHDALVEELENHADVHRLHEDLSNNGKLTELLDERVDFELEEVDPSERKQTEKKLRNHLETLDSRTQLQAVASNATVTRHSPEGEEFGGENPDRRFTTSMGVEEPLSNLYFQRDQQFVTQRGVVVCRMNKNTRRQETEIVRPAWEALDGVDIEGYDESLEVDVVADLSEADDHEVPFDDVETTEVTAEGGDFIPAGEFSLMGVSARIEHPGDLDDGFDDDQTEHVLRTSYAAGHKLLMDGAFGAEEVGLVRAPYEAAMAVADGEETDMDIMHLDTWFNFVDDDLVVTHERLLNEATVDVYERREDRDQPYVLETRDYSLRTFLDERGFEVFDAVEAVEGHKDESKALKAVTNFLTLGPRKILPVRFDESDDGVMENFVRELQQGHDVEVVPDGTGIEIFDLRAAYGAIHCLTTPIRRPAPGET